MPFDTKELGLNEIFMDKFKILGGALNKYGIRLCGLKMEKDWYINLKTVITRQ